MKKLLLSLGLALCVFAHGASPPLIQQAAKVAKSAEEQYASVFYVESFSGRDDQERIEKAFAAATKVYGSTVDFGTRMWRWTRTIDVWSQIDPTYLCLHLRGRGYWAGLTYDGPNAGIRLHNWKDGTMEGIKMRRSLVLASDVESIGIECVTDGSSSRNELRHCRFQGFTTGYLNKAVGNSDMSVYRLTMVEATDCVTGVRFEGPNNLEPVLDQYKASFCKVGAEFLGGSGFTMMNCGGSYNDVFARIRGGFFFATWMNTTEDSGLIYQIGGEGLDGYGQEANCEINDGEHRAVKTAIANVFKAGETTIKVKSTRGGSSVINLTNKSGKQAFFYGSSNLNAKKIEGDWKVSQAVGVEIGK